MKGIQGDPRGSKGIQGDPLTRLIPMKVYYSRAALSFDFEITRMISDQMALHSVQLPLYIYLIFFLFNLIPPNFI